MICKASNFEKPGVDVPVWIKLRLKAWKAFIFFNAQASERVPGAVSSWLIATCYFYMLWKPLWPLALLRKPPEFCQQQLAQEPSSYQSKSDGFGVDFNQHTVLWNTVRIRPWGMRAVSCTLASRNHVWMLFLSWWKVKIWKYLSTAGIWLPKVGFHLETAHVFLPSPNKVASPVIFLTKKFYPKACHLWKLKFICRPFLTKELCLAFIHEQQIDPWLAKRGMQKHLSASFLYSEEILHGRGLNLSNSLSVIYFYWYGSQTR